MFGTDDAKYLIRQLGRANVVLFTGAGFSCEASNKKGKPIPLAAELAAELWPLLSTGEEYSGESLSEVYEAVIESGVPFTTIRNFLEEQLLCKSIPPSYAALTIPFWYRIYTLNVDNLIESIYTQSHDRKLEILAYPNDDVTDRDQSLYRTQAVHLNGRLPCRPDELTFSPTQYARAASQRQPLYEQFVRDYSSKPVLFVGTKIDEPLFWKALQERGDRVPSGEGRPKSFLIARHISHTKRLSLARLNVEPIVGDVKDFLQWLAAIEKDLPSRINVLKVVAPDIAAALQGDAAPKATVADLTLFGSAFAPVPTETPRSSYRSQYLLGAAPRWDDLLHNLDAPRSITPSVINAVEAALGRQPTPIVIALLGTAGSGKSTILRRAGLTLARSGHSVFVTNSESLPSPDVLRRIAAAHDGRIVLMFDNAEVALAQIPDLVAATATVDRPPVFVIGSRTNDFDRLWRSLGDVEFEEFVVPNLDRQEILALVRLLDDQGLLGSLRGMTTGDRVKAFEETARKQILVAMREATTSRGFDEIMRDEFEKVVPLESKLLYLCAALATDAGFRLTKDEMLGCSRVEPAKTLEMLRRNLNGIVLPVGANNDLFLLRHRLIAEVVVEQLAPRPLLREAYVRVLGSLSIHARRHWRDRTSQLVRALLNHRTIYGRFRHDIEEARAVFESLINQLGTNPHFWLQFGNLELEGVGGNLTVAENYLRQAESLEPTNTYIQNALGHLLLKKGVYASSKALADELRRAGSEILENRIKQDEFSDAYAIHIFCRQRYEWMKSWMTADDERKRELELLRDYLTEAVRVHSRHNRLYRLKQVIDRAYLYLAIPKSERPAAPVAEDM